MSSTWKLIKPHVPLIRFKKGTSAIKSALGANKASAGVGGTSNAISDRQLPTKYSRKPVTQEEIDSIELGGAL